MSKLIEQLMEMEEDTQKDKFLTFSLGNEAYGIEIKYVTEIIGIQPITQVPELPEYVKGIINLRGKIIPVMDVRLRFKKEPKIYDERTCTVVVEIDNVSVGLIVDTVSEVMRIPEENIAIPPSISQSQHNSYVKGIGRVNDEVKLLLDCAKLLSNVELEELEKVV
jgi:purine-binding chemotaxis protein CheW